MKRVALPILAVLAGACVAKADTSSRLSGSEWRFVTIDAQQPERPGLAMLSFGEEGLSANAGCNAIGGEWRVENNRLIAGPLTSTMMHCEGLVWEQEQAVGALLVAAPQIEISGDRMTLRSSGHSAELERFSPRR